VPLYLTDASIWIAAQRRQDSYLAELVVERLAGGEIAACTPTALEVLVGPASAAELQADWDAVWAHVTWLPVSEHVMDRALELLLGLARTTRGAHRRRPSDYLVAACAEAAGEGTVLWHWDRDLTAICDFAGIPHEPEHDRARAERLGPEPGA
jgi:predicted nucleic acid-binding protein